MRLPQPLTVLLLLSASAHAQTPELPPDLITCPLLDRTETGIQTTRAEQYQVAIREGRVAVIVLDLPRGAQTRTDFVPAPQPGTSIRLTAFPKQTPPGAFSLVFNHTTLTPDGTVAVETYIGATDRPGAPPATITYRLACGAEKTPR